MPKTDKAIRECLQLWHETWQRGQETFGDAYNSAITRLVVLGWMEKRPYDYSQLAAALRVSRQQVMRRCARLGKSGWLINQREENHVYVMPTPALVEYTQTMVDASLPRVMSRYGKLAAGLVAAGALAGDQVGVVAKVGESVVEIVGKVLG